MRPTSSQQRIFGNSPIFVSLTLCFPHDEMKTIALPLGVIVYVQWDSVHQRQLEQWTLSKRPKDWLASAHLSLAFAVLAVLSTEPRTFNRPSKHSELHPRPFSISFGVNNSFLFIAIPTTKLRIVVNAKSFRALPVPLKELASRL